jgi:hypothetical protein
MPQLKLLIDVPESKDQETVIDYLNCVALCKLEEDLHEITGWEWVRDGE